MALSEGPTGRLTYASESIRPTVGQFDVVSGGGSAPPEPPPGLLALPCTLSPPQGLGF